MSPSTSETWRRRLRAAWARPQPLFITPEGGEFEAWCRAHPGTAVELHVSARALHELVIDASLPLPDAAALRAYAEQQFDHYFGAAAQRFAIAPWQAGSARGASALHGLDLADLQTRARAAGVRIAALRPAWSVWMSALPAAMRTGTGRLVWLEPDVRVEVQLEQGRVASVLPRRSRGAGAAAAADTKEAGAAAGAAAPDEALAPALAVGRPGAVLTPQPGPVVPAPDFVGQPARSRLAWPLAATSLLVLATAGWSLAQSQRGWQAAREAQAWAAAHRPAAASRAATGPLRAAAPTRGLLEAGQLLGVPWEATLTRIEAGGAESEGIAWLGLEVSAARGEIKLEGLTQDKQVALRLADRLAGTPGWGQVVLSRFAPAEPGQTGQRFEISAKRLGSGGAP